MCATCGCSDDAGVRITDPAHGHGHAHEHGHATAVGTEPCGVNAESRTVSLEIDLLARNDGLAARNRQWFTEHAVVALNLMSSPGSGKTTLLERTIRELDGSRPCAVLEGDQETLLDADRITATGARVVQINTGAGCHLDADMVLDGMRALAPEPGSLLFVENVGNLVCPALFDLGESARVVIISVTEGADKPLKYPHMFRTADLVLINKVDLLPHVDFDVERCAGYVRRARPDAEILHLSATRGDGVDAWYDWLRRTGNDGRHG